MPAVEFESWIKAHHIRHLISGTIVFLICIAADVSILDYRRDKPHTVQWQSGELQTNYRMRPAKLPGGTNAVEVGIVDDGSFVWRKR